MRRPVEALSKLVLGWYGWIGRRIEGAFAPGAYVILNTGMVPNKQGPNRGDVMPYLTHTDTGLPVESGPTLARQVAESVAGKAIPKPPGLPTTRVEE